MSRLEVRNLSISFKDSQSKNVKQGPTIISDLSLTLEAGEVLAIVGSSGSGKSLLAQAILGILPSHAKIKGCITYEGEEVTPKRQLELCGKEIAYVPQSVTYLDPLMTVGKQIQGAAPPPNVTERQNRLFSKYKLKREVDTMFPHELSGGMARRVLLSTAMITDAKVIIADEPTPGLDSKVLDEALQSLKDIAHQGSAVMLITHDIESALKIADRIAVFYCGTIVEITPVSDFSDQGQNLRHPYSKALWQALPKNDFKPIVGSQPSPDNYPSGCLFSPRCNFVSPDCEKNRPELRHLRAGMVRCIHAT